MLAKPKLYIKPGCPWCEEALKYFKNQGVDLDLRNVSLDPKEMSAMINVSGQTCAPTFEFEDFIVADFSVEEFVTELNKFPEVQIKLGMGKTNS
ncbi:MAG: glutaredoxin family protein [Puniceicoccaceae bacterium]|nr:glutaredoxin family protein [Puniceicoccaceae bacterium]